MIISPLALQAAACNEYLGGREPQTDAEWELCVSFWAYNIEPSVALKATQLMAKIMACPLLEDDVQRIVEFQLLKKAEAAEGK